MENNPFAAMNAERTSLYLRVETKRHLVQAAHRLGKTQTELVNEALTQYLANLKKPKFAFIGAGADTVVSARTSEQWLRKYRKRSRK
jgi:predicted DNA-binding protein